MTIFWQTNVFATKQGLLKSSMSKVKRVLITINANLKGMVIDIKLDIFIILWK